MAAGDRRVEVGALSGGVRVVVPDGVRARTNGPVVFGGVGCAGACAPGATGPEPAVDARDAPGSVRVVTAAEPAREEAEDARGDGGDQDDRPAPSVLTARPRRAAP